MKLSSILQSAVLHGCHNPIISHVFGYNSIIIQPFKLDVIKDFASVLNAKYLIFSWHAKKRTPLLLYSIDFLGAHTMR